MEGSFSSSSKGTAVGGEIWVSRARQIGTEKGFPLLRSGETSSRVWMRQVTAGFQGT